MSFDYTYSRNTDFVNLVDPPNEPQLDVLTRQIEDSGITAVDDGISTEGTDDDIIVKFMFLTELSPAEVTLLNGVVAAHTGVPTTGEMQVTNSLGESTNTTTTFANKLNFTLAPMRKGTYQVAVSCETRLGTGTTSLASMKYAEAKVLFNDATEAAFSAWPFALYHDFMAAGKITVRAGDTPNLKLQFRRSGSVADTAYIRRARLMVTPVDSEA